MIDLINYVVSVICAFIIGMAFHSTWLHAKKRGEWPPKGIFAISIHPKGIEWEYAERRGWIALGAKPQEPKDDISIKDD